MMSKLNLADIDLVRTPAMPNLTVEIEGLGHMKIGGPASSMIEQIGHAYVMLGTRRTLESGDRLEKKVTVVALDTTRLYNQSTDFDVTVL